ncbi:DUF21 domain-containing protein [archaeon]|jgi:metal transporter CNNM|nr:DUF21 domain-containing protein [archaeon]MBT7128386.1 DUF21 domain-containing protein [archaeon]
MISVSVILIIVLLVALSGLFSGLTLGLLGLDKSELERKIRLGDEKARKVYGVRKRGNLLLCTLLLGNVGVNSAIAILLGSVAAGVVAGVVATGLIVVFGEILPQAFVSRHAMAVGARTAWLVKIFIFVLYPICWPISKALDKMLGDEMGTVWSRRELKEIVTHHRKSDDSRLDRDEERILHGALSFSDKVVSDVMISRSHVFALEVDNVIDKKLLKKMQKFGFSRFPVYRKRRDNIVGILFFRDLVGVSSGKKVRDVYEKKKLKVLESRKLDSLLGMFIKEKIHMAVVFNNRKKFVGVVTMEDVVEEIFGKEIVDEDDFFEDVEKGKRV